MTRVMAKPRLAGKTTRMLRWMEGNPSGVCVTINEAEAARVRRMADELGLDIEGWRFVSVHNARHALQGRPMVRVGVDNADMVLAELIGQRVEVMTVTG